MSSTTYDKNLEIWSHFYPKEAVMLPYLEDESYHFVKGQLVGPKGPYPTEDSESWFKSLPLKGEWALVIYGLGWGEMYPAIKKWLNQNKRHRVFFFEEDPTVISRFFDTPQAQEILEDPQVEIHYLKELDEKDPSLEKFYWSCILSHVVVVAHPAYKEWYPKRFSEFEHAIHFTTQMKNALLDEYMAYGVSFFRSFYFNILDLPEAYQGDKLFGKFEGVPAIICGAGPSLEKQLPLLKELKDRAFIAAGGSSLNALSSGGIIPHFSCGLDPNPEQAVRLRSNNAKGVPFFYRNRMFVEAFRLISGPKIYITGSGGYEVSDYFEEQLGIDGEYIDEGHNVINFLCEIALRLGCSPIILVGVDLAYTDLKLYSKGVVEKDKLSEETLPSSAILRTSTYGKQVWTEWKWMGEAHWVKQFSEDHPEVKVINCTDGGLGMEGVTEMPLKEAASQYLTKNLELVPRFNKALEAAKSEGITHEKMRELMSNLQMSLKNCHQHLSKMKEEAHHRKETNPLEGVNASIAFEEEKLASEIGYKYILDLFNHILASIQNSSLRTLRINKEGFSPVEIEKKKLELQLERIDFLMKVADINSQIIEVALNEPLVNGQKSPLPPIT